MHCSVRVVAQNFEVIYGIVHPVSIDMVDNLCSEEFPAKHEFYYMAMLVLPICAGRAELYSAVAMLDYNGSNRV